MSSQQQMVLCKQCEKKKMDMSRGIVCSLTNEKPTFLGNCEEFVIDPQEAQRVTARRFTEEDDDKSSNSRAIWIAVGVVLIILKIVLRLAR